MTTIYDHQIKDANNETVDLSMYRGKVLVVVNVASKCGFTPQYKDLQNLYDTYNEQGLEIIGFPCNQFKNQEPGTNKDIQEFCQLNYGVTFPVYSKIDVNGDNEHPLYTFLKNEKKGLLGKDIKWNFTKFLIDRDGNVVKRFGPQVNPTKMTKDIETIL